VSWPGWLGRIRKPHRSVKRFLTFLVTFFNVFFNFANVFLKFCFYFFCLTPHQTKTFPLKLVSTSKILRNTATRGAAFLKILEVGTVT